MNEWLSVKQRPPSYTDVLVTDGIRCWVAQSALNLDVFIASHPDYDREFKNDNASPYHTYANPKYWIPLPKKPETLREKMTNNPSKLVKCDMCGSKITNRKCEYGEWHENTEDHPIRKALENFHEMKKISFTTDASHLGCAAVFFRGDYNDCMKVQDFIYEMKGRKFYGEMKNEN